MESHKELFRMCSFENEGVKFWLNVLTEIQNSDVRNILIAYVGGLKGFSEARNTVFSQTRIQLCSVHIRNSM